MAAETTSLVLGVDSTQVKTATNTLNSFSDSGKKAETTATALEAAARKVGEAAPRVGSAGAALGAAQKKSKDLGDALKLTAHQTQQLSFQLNDFAVQVASGQSPLTALIQQGSQLSGTFGGIGGALKAVGTIFTTTRVLIGGAAGVLGAFALAAYEGSQQSEAFRKSIALTGNAAGITEGQFNNLGKTIAGSTNASIGTARQALQDFVSTGLYSGEALTETAKAAVLFGKATGASAEDVLKGFSNMKSGVAKWAEETNRQYHFLSATQLEYIKTLEEQGDSQKAIAVTMQALQERVKGAAVDVGLLDRAWTSAKNAASGFADAVKSIGRNDTTQDQLSALQKRLEDMQARGPLNSTPGVQASFNKGVEQLREQIDLVREKAGFEDKSVKAQANSAQTEQARISFGKLQEASLTKQEQLAKAIANANALADKAGISAEDRARVLADIRQKFYTDPAKTSLATDLANIQRNLNSTVDAYANAESILEANRSAGLLNEKDYYDAKLGFIRLNSEAEVRALQQESARISSEKITGRDSVEIANKQQEAQKQIADNTARIAIIKADATARGVVLDTQQTASLSKVEAGFMSARQAADEYLRTLTLQGQREAEAVGQSDKQRGTSTTLNQIKDRFDQQRQELENNRSLLESQKDKDGNSLFTDDQRKQYDERLAIINDYNAQALDSFQKSYTAIAAAEANWSNGASRAFANYIDEAQNTAKVTESFFTKTINGFADALTEFVTTGKLDFKSFAQSVITDIIRIQVQSATSKILSAILGVETGGASTALGVGAGYVLPGSGKATGGNVGAHSLQQVNERGPELLNVGSKQYLMMGGNSGKVTPSNGWGGGQSFDFSGQTINVGQGVSRGEVMAALQQSRAETIASIKRSTRQGTFA